jgi:hypothetical protein
VWKWILAHIWYALGSTPGIRCDTVVLTKQFHTDLHKILFMCIVHCEMCELTSKLIIVVRCTNREVHTKLFIYPVDRLTFFRLLQNYVLRSWRHCWRRDMLETY